MVRVQAPFAPETRVGLVGGGLLAVTYSVLGRPESVSVPFEVGPFVPHVTAALVVGAAVGVLAYGHVPEERRTRRAHLRTIALMLLGPLVLLGAALLLLGAGAVMFFDAFDLLVQLGQGGTGGSSEPFIGITLGMVVITIVLLALLLVGVVIAAGFLQASAVVGYVLAVLVLDRLVDSHSTATGAPPGSSD